MIPLFNQKLLQHILSILNILSQAYSLNKELTFWNEMIYKSARQCKRI